MTALADKTCRPCEGGIPPLAGDAAREHFKELHEDWELVDGDTKLRRVIARKDFNEGLELVNRIGDIAERENHHPDVLLTYPAVTITLSTHAIGGLSENDFILAAKIDLLLQN
ncbi:MAG: 4a-hydroxytetrahydrobiopterin dehydratase [Candidatus Spechtbacterales bacterium]